MKKSHRVATSLAMLTAVGGSMGVTATASADPILFAEDFSAGSLPSHLHEIDGSPTYEPGHVQFGGVTEWEDIKLLRTNRNDYHTQSWVSLVTVNFATQIAEGESEGMLYMGFGKNEAGQSNYGEYTLGPVVTVEMGSTWPWGQNYMRSTKIADGDNPGDSNQPEANNIGPDSGEGFENEPATHRVRFEYDHVAQTVSIMAEKDYDGMGGLFVPDVVWAPRDVSGLDFEAELNGDTGPHGHLAFGAGGVDATLSEWHVVDPSDPLAEVVPEPGSLALLGMGGLMLLRRRRS